MQDFKILKIVDKFKGIYKKFGVDYETMKLILKMKLTTDSRRVTTALNDAKKDENKNQFKRGLIVYAVLGVFFAFLLIVKIDIMFQMSLHFSAVMFFILTIFISDFSAVILDVRDKTLIGTKGIDNKTINAAKFTHILLYIFQITLAFCGPSLVVSIRYGIGFVLIFLIEIILMNILLVTLTALIYFLILKFFDGEKLKDIINMCQIFLTVVMAVGYQVVIRMFDISQIEIAYTDKLINYFLPPMWFAAPLELIDSGKLNVSLVILSALVIVVPIISIVVYFKNAKNFEEYLMKLNDNTEKNKKSKGKFTLKLSKFICRDKVENAFFNFSFNMLSKERDLKLRIYPSLALAAVFPLIFLFMDIGDVNDLSQSIRELSQGKSYLTMYALVMFAAPMVSYIQFSKEFKGSWIYKALPIDDHKKAYKGAVKAFIYKFITPLLVFDGVIYLAIFNSKFMIHLVIMIFSIILMIVISFKSFDINLPFSMEYYTEQSSNTVVPFVLSFFVGAILVFSHYMSTKINYGVYVYLIIIGVISIISWKVGFKIKTKKSV